MRVNQHLGLGAKAAEVKKAAEKIKDEQRAKEIMREHEEEKYM